MPKNALCQSDFTGFCTAKLGVAPHRIINDIVQWLDEDHGAGDPSLFAGFNKNLTAQFFVIAKQDFTLSGLPIMQETFNQTSSGQIKLYSDFEEGDSIPKGSVVIAGEGYASSILLAERVALNLSSKLSGITTKTKSILSEIRKYSSTVSLLETRKTTPGLRIYEKYATRVAGARNHRHGLDTGAMLKENHLRSIGSIEEALDNLNKNIPILTKIEIEVSNLNEFRAALNRGADVIMLDNFSYDDVKIAVQEKNKINKNIKLELSGNLDEKNIEEIASLGVDYLSMGALIHKAIWVDMSLQLYLPA
ncbi:nicotinate-nucleotide diphosphorylase (carboxylating) [Silvanigrella aquatica]|uniref:nicotinate-nucleotide diphosphorylase (carboxylating) n=2 Tax=Silvanigrella aquatica TaxID=1915309 RepID=A0A1L4D4U5_9BACT|nr:nicotinate-nucleotide diphosphorylase (carboxylating) [Silvanigrella aquatica]